MIDCIICEYSQQDHYGSGCHGRTTLFSACACTFVEQPPLRVGADADAHQERSDRWDRQARTSWDLALESRHDLDRWHPLMRFHRLARRAEIDHRLYAQSLQLPSTSRVAPLDVPPPYAVVPVASPQPVMSMSRRLELASIA